MVRHADGQMVQRHSTQAAHCRQCLSLREEPVARLNEVEAAAADQPRRGRRQTQLPCARLERGHAPALLLLRRHRRDTRSDRVKRHLRRLFCPHRTWLYQNQPKAFI